MARFVLVQLFLCLFIIANPKIHHISLKYKEKNKISQKKMKETIEIKQNLNKFLIVQTVPPSNGLFGKGQMTHDNLNQKGQSIHRNMIKRGWTPYGCANAQQADVNELYKLHVINADYKSLLSKAQILQKIQNAFEDSPCQFLSLFLVGHGAKVDNPKHAQYTHVFNIINQKEKTQLIQLRQILNLWQPNSFKHLLICIYSCQTSVITKIMKEYKFNNSITVISSADKNDKFEIYPEGQEQIKDQIDIHIFGAQVNEATRRIRKQLDPKLVVNGYHEYWINRLKYHFQQWEEQKEQTTQLMEKTKSIHKNTENTKKKGKLNKSKSESCLKYTSRYFGQWTISEKSGKHNANGKGFMQGQGIYFQGLFKNQVFAQGRLYRKFSKISKYGKFYKYYLSGLGCAMEDNGNFIIKHFKQQKVPKPESPLWYNLTQQLFINQKQSNLQQYCLTIKNTQNRIKLWLRRNKNEPNYDHNSDHNKIVSISILVSGKQVKPNLWTQRPKLLDMQKQYQYESGGQYHKQYRTLTIKYQEIIEPNLRPQIFFTIISTKNGAKVQEDDYKEYFKQFNIFHLLNKYSGKVYQNKQIVYHFDMEFYYLKISHLDPEKQIERYCLIVNNRYQKADEKIHEAHKEGYSVIGGSVHNVDYENL